MKWWIIAVLTTAAAMGIIITVLYFTLGAGDSEGNKVNINNNKKDEGEKGADTNIIQKTSQGGIHILECTGQLHINWQILLALGLIIMLILLVKWSIQYNLCKFITCQYFSISKNPDNKREKHMNNKEGENFDLAERGQISKKGDKQTDKQTDRGNDRPIDNQTRRQTDRMLRQSAQLEKMPDMVCRAENDDMENVITGLLHFISGMREMRR